MAGAEEVYLERWIQQIPEKPFQEIRKGRVARSPVAEPPLKNRVILHEGF